MGFSGNCKLCYGYGRIFLKGYDKLLRQQRGDVAASCMGCGDKRKENKPAESVRQK